MGKTTAFPLLINKSFQTQWFNTNLHYTEYSRKAELAIRVTLICHFASRMTWTSPGSLGYTKQSVHTRIYRVAVRVSAALLPEPGVIFSSLPLFACLLVIYRLLRANAPLHSPNFSLVAALRNSFDSPRSVFPCRIVRVSRTLGRNNVRVAKFSANSICIVAQTLSRAISTRANEYRASIVYIHAQMSRFFVPANRRSKI